MRELSEAGVEFVRERHLATLSTMAPWGGIHSVPVGFTLHDGVLRVITSRDSQKVRNVLRDGTATISQVDGARWLAFPGGYHVPEPMCVPLIVRANGRETRAEVRVGAGCG